MKKVLINVPDLPKDWLFDTEVRDTYYDPGIYLRERLQDLGYQLENFDNQSLKNCVWVWFYDSISVRPYYGWRGKARLLKAHLTRRQLVRDLYGECLCAGMAQRTALFLWEPPAISPWNWEPNLHNLFSVIFTWNDEFVDGQKYHKIHWPQTRQFPPVPKVPFAPKKLLVNISMNKHSRHFQELYSARRETIRHFERALPDDFDLYGVGWNRPVGLVERALPFLCQKYPSYRGTVRHKWDVLPHYRFSVCYENMRDEPGWITEKIFDSMRAGCVPIYWGAPNITDYVDEEAFIDRRKFKSDKELEAYIVGISEKEYINYLEAIESYLASSRFAKFLPPAFADTVIRVLGL
jgi:hypothetical protein